MKKRSDHKASWIRKGLSEPKEMKIEQVDSHPSSTQIDYHLFKEIKSEGQRKRQKFYCSRCNFNTFYKGNLKKHRLVHLKSKYLKCEKSLEKKKIKIFKCSDCNFSTTIKPALKNHALSHLNTNLYPFICSLCNFRTKYKFNLKTHTIRMHKNNSTVIGILENKAESGNKGKDVSLWKRESVLDVHSGNPLEEQNIMHETLSAEVEIGPTQKTVQINETNLTKEKINSKISLSERVESVEMISAPLENDTLFSSGLIDKNKLIESNGLKEFCNTPANLSPNIDSLNNNSYSSSEIDSSTFTSVAKADISKREMNLTSNLSLTEEKPLFSYAKLKVFKCSLCAFETKYKCNLKTHEIRIHSALHTFNKPKDMKAKEIQNIMKWQDNIASKQNSPNKLDLTKENSSLENVDTTENLSTSIPAILIGSTKNGRDFTQQDFYSSEINYSVGFTQKENKAGSAKSERSKFSEEIALTKHNHCKEIESLKPPSFPEKTGSVKEFQLSEEKTLPDNSSLSISTDSNAICFFKQHNYWKTGSSTKIHSIKEKELKDGISLINFGLSEQENVNNTNLPADHIPLEVKKYLSYNHEKEKMLQRTKILMERNHIKVNNCIKNDSLMEKDPSKERDSLMGEDSSITEVGIIKDSPKDYKNKTAEEGYSQKETVSLMENNPLMVKVPVEQKNKLMDFDILMEKDSSETVKGCVIKTVSFKERHNTMVKGPVKELGKVVESDLLHEKDFLTENDPLIVKDSLIKDDDPLMTNGTLMVKSVVKENYPLTGKDSFLDCDPMGKKKPENEKTPITEKDPMKKKPENEKTPITEKDPMKKRPERGKAPLIVKDPLMENDPLIEGNSLMAKYPEIDDDDNPLMEVMEVIEVDPLMIEPLTIEDPLMECNSLIENTSLNNLCPSISQTSKEKEIPKIVVYEEKDCKKKYVPKKEEILKKEMPSKSNSVPKIHMNPIVVIDRLKENTLLENFYKSKSKNDEKVGYIKGNIAKNSRHTKIHFKGARYLNKKNPNKKGTFCNPKKRAIESLTCNECNFVADSKKNLRQHFYIHSEVKAFKCSQCAYSTDLKASLKQHEYTHMETKVLHCSMCNYATNFKGNLRVHELNHTNFRKYKCPKCNFATNLKNQLRLHRVSHLDMSNLKCWDCDFQTDKKKFLREHLLDHRGNHPVPSKKKLRKHQVNHPSKQKLFCHSRKYSSKQKAYECPKCWFTCNSQNGLKQHSLTHLEFKIYNCSLCDFETNYRASLLKHLLNHEANNDLGV